MPKSDPRKVRKPSKREQQRLATLNSVNQAIGAGRLEREPLQRTPPFVVIGTADIGDILWCDAKATYSQKAMEGGYLARLTQVAECNSSPPSFLNLNDSVVAVEVEEPDSLEDEVGEDSEELEDWETAEIRETRGTWHVGFAASFSGEQLGIFTQMPVLLVGITDGVLESGTVIEVRQSSWEWSGIRRNRVDASKEAQANIYSVMLGLKSWRCVFICSDGRFVSEGNPDEGKALDDIKRAVSLRLGLEKPRGIATSQQFKCVRGRCKFALDCPISPASQDERIKGIPKTLTPEIRIEGRGKQQ